MNRFAFACSRRRRPPVLTFAPLAWLKLQFFCHAGPTEIGGFATAAADNLLYVEEFQTVRQQVTPLSVQFDDQAVADFFDACVDRGLTPDRFARIWCHTHPAASVEPSTTDEETFWRSFGGCDWAVMFILGRTGLSSARLSFAAGPRGDVHLPVEVDWAAWPASAPDALPDLVADWSAEFTAHIHPLPEPVIAAPLSSKASSFVDPWDGWDPWDGDAFHPSELEEILHEPFA